MPAFCMTLPGLGSGSSFNSNLRLICSMGGRRWQLKYLGSWYPFRKSSISCGFLAQLGASFLLLRISTKDKQMVTHLFFYLSFKQILKRNKDQWNIIAIYENSYKYYQLALIKHTVNSIGKRDNFFNKWCWNNEKLKKKITHKDLTSV